MFSKNILTLWKQLQKAISMLFTTFPGMGNMELILSFLAILVYLQIIWTVINLLKNKHLTTSEKLFWLLIVFFFPVIGTLLYLYYGMPRKA